MVMETTNLGDFIFALAIVIGAIAVGWLMAREYYLDRIDDIVAIYEKERREYKTKLRKLKQNK